MAVVLPIDTYRRLTGAKNSLAEHLTSFPKWEPPEGETDVFDEVQADRGRHRARQIDLEFDA